MTEIATLDAYGRLTAPTTLTIQRLLPGPAERIWSYLTESDLRRQWLAAGDMVLEPGAPFEFVWRNEELKPPSRRPEGAAEEHRLQCEILEVDPPRRLVFTWGTRMEVSFELEPRGQKVLLTIVHSRLPDRSTTLSVSTGWHAHLDVLEAVVSGQAGKPFWDNCAVLKKEYDKRLPV